MECLSDSADANSDAISDNVERMDVDEGRSSVADCEEDTDQVVGCNPSEADGTPGYQEIVQQLEDNESDKINAAIDDEFVSANASDCGEVLVDGVFSQNRMAEMQESAPEKP